MRGCHRCSIDLPSTNMAESRFFGETHSALGHCWPPSSCSSIYANSGLVQFSENPPITPFIPQKVTINFSVKFINFRRNFWYGAILMWPPHWVGGTQRDDERNKISWFLYPTRWGKGPQIETFFGFQVLPRGWYPPPIPISIRATQPPHMIVVSWVLITLAPR